MEVKKVLVYMVDQFWIHPHNEGIIVQGDEMERGRRRKKTGRKGARREKMAFFLIEFNSFQSLI